MKNPCPGLWLPDIQEQTKHLTFLTNNLITLSRMEEERTRLQMIDFPFSDVVEETVKSFQALARTQNKTFETSIQPMISLYGDEKSLTQLVSILLDNAMKYSTPKGEISLRLEKAGNNVKLSVYNTADSINREQLPHLFDRFTGQISQEAPGPVATVSDSPLPLPWSIPIKEKSQQPRRMNTLC